MKQFFSDLLSDSPRINSKRFNGLIGLILLSLVIFAIIWGRQVDSSVIYSLIGLILGNSALTIADKRE